MVAEKTLLSVDEALERVLAQFARLSTEEIAIDEALGRVLAQEVQAANDMPPFANSSMDGYAVRAADIANASQSAPITLDVIADIPAGSSAQVQIGAGQAARIMTGAPLPAGADAIVPVEETNDAPYGLNSGERLAGSPPARIDILKASRVGDFVRPVGEDIHVGQTVLHEGRVLRAADLGVLAGLGVPRVQVIKQPVVAILSTGDELLNADAPLAPGKIRDMNGYTLPALIQQLGARPLRLGIARDTMDDVRAHFEQAIAAKADLIVSSAGVSVGAYDVVKAVIESLGGISFWRVNMRPGKPLAFGSIKGTPFLGLPGNPVSSMVSFDVFARPAILKMAGRAWQSAISEAELAEPLKSDGRQSYIRVTLERRDGKLIAHSTGNQSSGVLTSLVNADGLMIVPAGMVDVPAGIHLPVRLLTDNI